MCGPVEVRQPLNAPRRAYGRVRSVNVASVMRCGFPVVAKAAIPTGGVARMADIAGFWNIMALSREQKKLFPHFGEPSIAVF